MVCRIGLVLVVVAGSIGAWSRPATGSESPLYPDLMTRPPVNLILDTEEIDGQVHHVLRFSNVVENIGAGRLEVDLEGDEDRDGGTVVYQNLYDAQTDGDLVARHPIRSNLNYHDAHDHYHIEDFTLFQLLEADADGVYQPTGHGTKESVCLVDNTRVMDSGAEQREYRRCDGMHQGLSSGWADIYYASFPEQWIDLGSQPLADGHYALRSTVDPDHEIDEGGPEAKFNNTAATYFSVVNGELVGLPPPAACALPEPRGTVGTAVRITCSNFAPGERVNIIWAGDGSRQLVGRYEATAQPEDTTQITLPESPLGGQRLSVEGTESGRETGVLFFIEPDLRLSAAEGRAGDEVTVALTGFGAREAVILTWSALASDPVPIARVLTSSRGSASVTVRIPDTPPGGYELSGTGTTTDGGASVSFAVTDTPATPVAQTPASPAAASPAIATPAVEPLATPETREPESAVQQVELGEAGTSSVVLHISATDAATVAVEYETDRSYGQAVRANEIGDGNYEASIPDLEPGTTYHYRVVAVGSGGQTMTEDATFITDQ